MNQIFVLFLICWSLFHSYFVKVYTKKNRVQKLFVFEKLIFDLLLQCEVWKLMHNNENLSCIWLFI